MNGGTPDYTGGLDKAISDGVLLELSDAVNRWMPNLKAYMDKDDNIRKQEHTDAGNIGAIDCIQNGNQPAWVGPGIREDLLKKVGITTIPQTYDDLYVALTKFKSQLAVEQPLALNYTGYSLMSYGMVSGFDVAPGFYNENGTVKYGFIEPGFKDYLTLMNKWYSEGLIDHDFYTRTAPTDFTAMDRIPAGKVGATEQMMYTLPHVYQALSGSTEFHMVAMPIPRKTADSVAHFRRFNEITGTTAIAVSTAVNDTDKLEKISRWLDYRFSEEGAVLLNYGIEGDTYTLVDGKPVFTDKILKDPNGVSSGDMMKQNTENPANGMLYDWTRDKSTVSDEEWAAYDVWGNSASGDWNMPPVTLTSEEGTEYATIYGDISTMISETIPQFITGQKPMSKYDAFVEQLKSMNIRDASRSSRPHLTDTSPVNLFVE
jgi:putative aldouronate transport system substrate-binding protein